MRCLVFCDKSHDVYMEMLVKYPVPEVEIVKAYVCGEDYQSTANIELFPLELVTETQSFDTAIIFLYDPEPVKKLLGIVYGDNTDYTILDQISFSKICLSGEGQLELLRILTTIKCPGNCNLIVGSFSYYTQNLTIKDEIRDGRFKVIVGKFCSIGPDVTFILAVEHQKQWNTTYPFYKLLKQETSEHMSVTSKGDIIIGNDVWIGEGTTILSGVEIGDGCIIGAKTVVTKSIEPYSVVVGNPGRIVKKRFPQERINKLLEMQWWDWDFQMIYDALNILQNEDIESLYAYWKKQ